MTTLKMGKLLASIVMVFSVAVTAPKADAAVAVNGCAGGSFGAACGLDELVAGGNFAINGAQFINWTLDILGTPFDAAAIQVTPIDSLANPGFTLTDTAGALRAVGGDSIQNILSFQALSPLSFANNTLGVAFGDIVNPGEFTFAEVSETVFDSSFSLIGNKQVLCDTPACANTVGTDSAAFPLQQGLLVFANINAAAEASGDIAQINSITLRFQQVPEPGSLVLVLGSAIIVGLYRRSHAPKRASSR